MSKFSGLNKARLNLTTGNVHQHWGRSVETHTYRRDLVQHHGFTTYMAYQSQASQKEQLSQASRGPCSQGENDWDARNSGNRAQGGLPLQEGVDAKLKEYKTLLIASVQPAIDASREGRLPPGPGLNGATSSRQPHQFPGWDNLQPAECLASILPLERLGDAPAETDDSMVGDGGSMLGGADSAAGDGDSLVEDADSTAGDADSMVEDADSTAGDADSMVGDADSMAGDDDSTLDGLPNPPESLPKR